VPDFDAIVVGSGISGGWVAKELCERGLKVLLLERGKEIDPAKDYADMADPWEKKHFDEISQQQLKQDFYVQGKNYAMKESNRHFWMTDSAQPYENVDSGPFRWRRGNQVGGKSLMWARASYRLAPYDFEVNKQDGEGVDWPVRYNDIAPWYDKVEKFAGIAGNRDGLAQLPDGKHFLPAFEHTCVELDLKDKLSKTHPERKMIMGRVAHLTRRITQVQVLDANTKAATSYSSKIVFLNASTIATTLILLGSAHENAPNGLANSSGQLGRNLMDHLGGSRVMARVRGHEDKYYYGALVKLSRIKTASQATGRLCLMLLANVCPAKITRLRPIKTKRISGGSRLPL